MSPCANGVMSDSTLNLHEIKQIKALEKFFFISKVKLKTIVLMEVMDLSHTGNPKSLLPKIPRLEIGYCRLVKAQ